MVSTPLRLLDLLQDALGAPVLPPVRLMLLDMTSNVVQSLFLARADQLEVPLRINDVLAVGVLVGGNGGSLLLNLGAKLKS